MDEEIEDDLGHVSLVNAKENAVVHYLQLKNVLDFGLGSISDPQTVQSNMSV